MSLEKAKVTVAVPSFRQGRFLDQALSSILAQEVPVEVFVMDGGSDDETLAVLDRWKERLAGWRSHSDGGQAAAVNEGIARGCAPYVCWLNSDDWLLPQGLPLLLAALEREPEAVMAYGNTWDWIERTGRRRRSMVLPFSEWVMARANAISQPGTLMRRDAWEAVGGLDSSLHMAMDYDLWWRLYRYGGAPVRVPDMVAVNRVHSQTKTNTQRRLHYQEAMAVVRRHYGKVPLKWWLAQPYAVWWRGWRGASRG
ncbi:MAG: glycosyltransferase [Ottowia sp.]|uniref:glycosyltransferase n=1 Tax=Ottowia sp. TaxID=1898956 RepID=UPI003C7969C2